MYKSFFTGIDVVLVKVNPADTSEAKGWAWAI